MNDSLTRKFCESRYRLAIVATATGLVALAAVWPLVDEYFVNRNSYISLSEELRLARETAETLPKLEQRVGEVQGKLAELEVRSVTEERLPLYRNRLVELVRQSDCQIRQFDIAAPTTRPWKQGDQALAETASSGAATPFVLERRSVQLSVDGSMTKVYELLERLKKEKMIAHAHSIKLQPAIGSGSTVTLELELWLYNLARSAG
jgi:hypothetical protein